MTEKEIEDYVSECCAKAFFRSCNRAQRPLPIDMRIYTVRLVNDIKKLPHVEGFRKKIREKARNIAKEYLESLIFKVKP